MSQSVEEIETTLIDSLHALTTDARDLKSILVEYDNLQAQTLHALRQNGADHLALAVQQAIAAARLSLVYERDADIDVAVRVFESSRVLGYVTPEAELVAAAIFARICLRHGHPELAADVFQGALSVTKLEDHQRESFAALLHELRASGSSTP